MKHQLRILGLLSVAATLTLGPATLNAQDAGGDQQQQQQPGRRNRGGGPGGGGPGNFDPEQMRQRMMERYREQLGVKDEAEWKLISERIEKVNEARRDGMRGMMGMFGGRGGPGGPGGGGGRGFGGEPNPDAEALQKAIEANAPADDIKAKLAKYRASVKTREEKLAKAQEDLKEVLSLKQEAQAVLMGLLK